jgi:TetR/AcrR family transcriptional regulator, transcriptional repressor for nem operon
MADEQLEPSEQVRAMIRAASDGDGSDNRFGCLIGNLSLELSGHSEEVRHCLTVLFDDWEKPFAAVIERAQTSGTWTRSGSPPMLARHIVNALQGALLRSKVDRRKTAVDDLDSLVFGTLLPTPAAPRSHSNAG